MGEAAAPLRTASVRAAQGSRGPSVEPQQGESAVPAGNAQNSLNPQDRDAARRRLYEREEALLRELHAGKVSPELQAELARVREAIRRSLRHEDGDVESDVNGTNGNNLTS